MYKAGPLGSHRRWDSYEGREEAKDSKKKNYACRLGGGKLLEVSSEGFTILLLPEIICWQWVLKVMGERRMLDVAVMEN